MLSYLHLTGFRNYQDQGFFPSPTLSFLVGPNGSGKTSLLEAIHVLATGRSFRTARLSHLVREGADECTLFAKVAGSQGSVHRIGIRRDRRRLADARLDGERVHTLSELARRLPVLVLHPGTVNLVDGGPGERRRYLDWLLFHVEQDFVRSWQQLKVGVVQRNHLLKSGRASLSELAAWDRQVAANSARIDALRRKYLPDLQAAFLDVLARFSGATPAVSLALHPGWPEALTPAEALCAQREQDRRRGFTGVGAHRADLVLRSGTGQVREVFSRGQQKIVAYALVLAQLHLLNRHSTQRCLVLVDDLSSELDAGNEQSVLSAGIETGNQMIVTSLDAGLPARSPAVPEKTVFHVEHGHLRQVQQGIQA